MVMPEHICRYGLKARYLLRRGGYAINDQWLTTRAETDAFKGKHDVETTPQSLSTESPLAVTTTFAAYSACTSPFAVPRAILLSFGFSWPCRLWRSGNWGFGSLVDLGLLEWFMT
jgi:hypothetical protein